jgi:quercetin dioxygenase-like cupin family protein
VAQALGIVHILVSGKATKYRLPEQPGQCLSTILATACVGQNITRHLGQTEYVVEFAIGEQPSIGGHHGTAKLEHQAAVKIEPNSIRFRFTRRVRPSPPRAIQNKLLIAISESRRPHRNSVRYPVNAGLKVMELPDVKERMAVLGFEPVANTPEEFAARIESKSRSGRKSSATRISRRSRSWPLHEWIATGWSSITKRKSVEMPNYQVKNVEPIVASDDIQARVFALAHGDVIPWHYHSESTDHYFVLQGTLTIETRGPDHRRVLISGERYKILPGTAHCISNESAADCQFLLIQGVGKYDWQKADVDRWRCISGGGEETNVRYAAARVHHSARRSGGVAARGAGAAFPGVDIISVRTKTPM